MEWEEEEDEEDEKEEEEEEERPDHRGKLSANNYFMEEACEPI